MGESSPGRAGGPTLRSGIVVMAIGLCCLAAAVLVRSGISAFVAGARTADGRVIELAPARTGKSPVVKFTAGGREIIFRSPNASNPPSYRVGETVAVLYDPEAPDRGPKIKTFFGVWTPFLVLLLLALIFGGVGLAMVVEQVKQRRQRAWLQHHGQRVKARVTRVKMVPAKRGLPGYAISAEWVNPKLQLKQFFTSDIIPWDPTEQVGDEVEVLVDPQDDERYLVDLSFLRDPD